MWTSVPSKPASRESSAQRAHQSTTSAMSSCSIAFARLAVRGRLDRRGPPEHAEVVGRVARGVDPEVVELGEDGRAVLVHALGHRAVDLASLRCRYWYGEPRHARGRRRVDEPVAGDQQAGAALRALDLVGDVAAASRRRRVVNSFTWAVCMIRLRTVTGPIRSGLNRCGYGSSYLPFRSGMDASDGAVCLLAGRSVRAGDPVAPCPARLQFAVVRRFGGHGFASLAPHIGSRS